MPQAIKRKRYENGSRSRDSYLHRGEDVELPDFRDFLRAAAVVDLPRHDLAVLRRPVGKRVGVQWAHTRSRRKDARERTSPKIRLFVVRCGV